MASAPALMSRPAAWPKYSATFLISSLANAPDRLTSSQEGQVRSPKILGLESLNDLGQIPGLWTGMEQLESNRSTMSLYGAGEFLQTGDNFVIPDAHEPTTEVPLGGRED